MCIESGTEMSSSSQNDDDSYDSRHSGRRRQASPVQTISSVSTQSIGRVMNEEQRRLYETKRALARTAGRLNSNLKAEIQVYEGKKEMEKRMNPLRRRDHSQEHDLVLGESALEIINLFKNKAEESRRKIHQLKQEVLNAQALTNKYKELYERTRKQQGLEVEDEDEDVASRTLSNAVSTTSDTSSTSTATLTIANLKKRSINFELEYERLQVKHQNLLHEIEKLKGEIQRLKGDNQQLISKIRRAEDEQLQAVNKYATSETARMDLEKRLEREKKQHQMLLQTVRKQTAEWLVEQRQLQQIDEEDKWNSIIPAEDRHILRPKEKMQQGAVNELSRSLPHGPGSVVSHATGLSNRVSEKSNVSRANPTRTLSQRKA